jgi:hypothetical protein
MRRACLLNTLNFKKKRKLNISRACLLTIEIAAQGKVCFRPKDCNVSKKTCFFDDPKVEVEIVVAWSALVSGKRQIAAQGGLFEIFQDQGWMSE